MAELVVTVGKEGVNSNYIISENSPKLFLNRYYVLTVSNIWYYLPK